MAKISIFGVLSNVQILLHTLLRGKCVGTDVFGNKYYKGKPRRGSKQERRWTIYSGETEASQIPPEWHGWMHHQTNTLPEKVNAYRKDWIKPHIPNLTGTNYAYLPPAMKGQPRAAATGDYIPWQPPQ